MINFWMRQRFFVSDQQQHGIRRRVRIHSGGLLTNGTIESWWKSGWTRGRGKSPRGWNGSASTDKVCDTFQGTSARGYPDVIQGQSLHTGRNNSFLGSNERLLGSLLKYLIHVRRLYKTTFCFCRQEDHFTFSDPEKHAVPSTAYFGVGGAGTNAVPVRGDLTTVRLGTQHFSTNETHGLKKKIWSENVFVIRLRMDLPEPESHPHGSWGT